MEKFNWYLYGTGLWAHDSENNPRNSYLVISKSLSLVYQFEDWTRISIFRSVTGMEFSSLEEDKNTLII